MKKLFAAIALIACSIQITLAQVKGQLTSLEELGEGSVLKQYWGITKEGNTYSAQASQQCELKFVNNVNNKLSAFQLNKEGKNEVLINCGFGFLKPNHYTEPSLFHSKTHGLAYVYINGLLYCIQKVSNPLAVESIVLENVYVLMKPAKGEHTSGKAALKELKTRNHEAVIMQYLNDMKAVQETATANFTDAIKAEIDAVDNKASADKAAIKAKNDAYWQSEEGQRKLAEMNKDKDVPTKVTIKNTGKGILTVIRDNGMTDHINGGSTSKFSCKDNIYYALKDKHGNYTVKGQLISGENNNCGGTVSAAGGN